MTAEDKASLVSGGEAGAKYKRRCKRIARAHISLSLLALLGALTVLTLGLTSNQRVPRCWECDLGVLIATPVFMFFVSILGLVKKCRTGSKSNLFYFVVCGVTAGLAIASCVFLAYFAMRTGWTRNSLSWDIERFKVLEKICNNDAMATTTTTTRNPNYYNYNYYQDRNYECKKEFPNLRERLQRIGPYWDYVLISIIAAFVGTLLVTAAHALASLAMLGFSIHYWWVSGGFGSRWMLKKGYPNVIYISCCCEPMTDDSVPFVIAFGPRGSHLKQQEETESVSTEQQSLVSETEEEEESVRPTLMV